MSAPSENMPISVPAAQPLLSQIPIPYVTSKDAGWTAGKNLQIDIRWGRRSPQPLSPIGTRDPERPIREATKLSHYGKRC